jgi:hypothetical protein
MVQSMANMARVRLLVNALLSDEYDQTTSVLERITADNTVENCCLGVACRVAMQHGLSLSADFDKSEGVTRFGGYIGQLPAKVRDWYGFSDVNPLLRDPEDPDDDGAEALATELNDSGRPFAWIAKAFEVTYLTGETV